MKRSSLFEVYFFGKERVSRVTAEDHGSALCFYSWDTPLHARWNACIFSLSNGSAWKFFSGSCRQ